jgi:hypothetical protein
MIVNRAQHFNWIRHKHGLCYSKMTMTPNK